MLVFRNNRCQAAARGSVFFVSLPKKWFLTLSLAKICKYEFLHGHRSDTTPMKNKQQSGWNVSHHAYVCSDSVDVEVPCAIFRQQAREKKRNWSNLEHSESDEESGQEHVVPRNGIAYRRRCRG